MFPELNNSRALTLIELVIVLSMIGILSAIAVPNIMGQLSHQKIRAAARDLCSTFQQVRLQAAKDNADVIIQFTPAVYVSGGAVGKYQVFLDNGSGSDAGDLTQDGTEQTLRTVTMPTGVSLVSASFTDGTNTYQAAGFNGQGLSAKTLSGSVELRSSDRWYKISLSSAGNIRLQMSADGTNWSGSI